MPSLLPEKVYPDQFDPTKLDKAHPRGEVEGGAEINNTLSIDSSPAVESVEMDKHLVNEVNSDKFPNNKLVPVEDYNNVFALHLTRGGGQAALSQEMETAMNNGVSEVRASTVLWALRDKEFKGVVKVNTEKAQELKLTPNQAAQLEFKRRYFEPDGKAVNSDPRESELFKQKIAVGESRRVVDRYEATQDENGNQVQSPVYRNEPNPNYNPAYKKFESEIGALFEGKGGVLSEDSARVAKEMVEYEVADLIKNGDEKKLLDGVRYQFDKNEGVLTLRSTDKNNPTQISVKLSRNEKGDLIPSINHAEVKLGELVSNIDFKNFENVKLMMGVMRPRGPLQERPSATSAESAPEAPAQPVTAQRVANQTAVAPNAREATSRGQANGPEAATQRGAERPATSPELFSDRLAENISSVFKTQEDQLKLQEHLVRVQELNQRLDPRYAKLFAVVRANTLEGYARAGTNLGPEAQRLVNTVRSPGYDRLSNQERLAVLNDLSLVQIVAEKMSNMPQSVTHNVVETPTETSEQRVAREKQEFENALNTLGNEIIEQLAGNYGQGTSAEALEKIMAKRVVESIQLKELEKTDLVVKIKATREELSKLYSDRGGDENIKPAQKLYTLTDRELQSFDEEHLVEILVLANMAKEYLEKTKPAAAGSNTQNSTNQGRRGGSPLNNRSNRGTNNGGRNPNGQAPGTNPPASQAPTIAVPPSPNGATPTSSTTNGA